MLRLLLFVFVSTLLVFSAGNFAAVRSPDSEIQFQSAEGLAFRGSTAVDQGLSVWKGFGTAKGIDSARYSIFGPLQPLILWPFISASDPLAHYFALDRRIPLPTSHYVGNFEDSLRGVITADRLPHARRFLVSFVNPLLGALAVSAFFAALLLLVESSQAALFATACLAFATPVWVYAGTYFSENLALCALLISFCCLMASWKSFPTRRQTLFLLGAGGFAGAACAAHISALLWVPFLMLLVSSGTESMRDLWSKEFLKRAALFSIGAAPALIFLAQYNFSRFGSFFETGRYVDLEAAKNFGYGYFILPVESLYGLVLSSGKGLFVFAPIVLLALLAQRSIFRAAPWLAKVLLTGALIRIVMIAARSDWHGGFALGPRYLVLALPFLVVPLAFSWLESKHRVWWLSVLAVCSFEQAYLCCGEIFSFYHDAVAAAGAQGKDIFLNDSLYFDWTYSPLLGFFGSQPAPYFIKLLGLSFMQGTYVLFGMALLSVYIWFKAGDKTEVFQ